MPKRPQRTKTRSTGIVITGSATHNFGFLAAIGNMIVSWGNNESVFQIILARLARSDREAATIMWLSLRSTQNRLDCISRLAKESIKDADLLEELEAMVKGFRAFTRARNFWCHATYRYSPNGDLMTATSMSLTQDQKPLAFETKEMTAATINELNDTSVRLSEFNQRLWALAERLGGPPSPHSAPP